MTPAVDNPLIDVLDSITLATEKHRGRVLVAGSHCGELCGWYAEQAGLRGVILNDAGVGLDQAGIAGLAWLESVGIPAATVNYLSARIGDGHDMFERGVISFCNSLAQTLGVAPRMSAAQAARLMLCPLHIPDKVAKEARHHRESRRVLLPDNGHGIEVVGLDSNSLVENADASRIVVTGSHGGLLGGRESTAIHIRVRAAAYNDAGGGADGAGYSRLPVLDQMGIPAVTVRHTSARIGDALSSWDTGIISCVNGLAKAAAIREGMTLHDAFRLIG